jgi:MoaA/NifB/PqqE/SkfB family radical SAM enzyme
MTKTQSDHSIHKFGQKLHHPAALPAFSQLVAGLRHYHATGSVEQLSSVPLVSINLDLTTACDHACGHCVDDEVINQRHKFELEDIYGTIDSLVERGLSSVILIGGGEPTLHPRFVDIVKHIKAKGLMVGLVTHGGHFERMKPVAQLFESRDWIRFSIDAGTNETYQDIHFHQSGKKARNSLEEILNNGRALREINPNLQLGFSYVVVPPGQRYHGRELLDNIDEIPLAAQLAVQHGFTYLSLKPCLIKGETEGETLMPGASADEVIAVTERIRARISEARAAQPMLRIVESQNLVAMLGQALEKLREQPKICYAGFLRQVVTPSGIFHCPAWRGDFRAKVGENSAYATVDTSRLTAQDSALTLTSFNAASTCEQIACFYNSMNRYIEGVVESDVEHNLLPASEALDTFL